MRTIKFYRTETGNCPVEDFLETLSDKQMEKVSWTLRAVRDMHHVPTQYLKKLKSTDNIWEVRITLGNNTFRLLGFYDGSNLLILTSGFAKKTNKVPRREIETAERRKQDYLRRK
jgi:phage-related protein